MNRIEVYDYKVSGHIDFRRLFPYSYKSTVEEFKRDGIELPDIEITNHSEWRVLLNPVRVDLTTNLGLVTYDFKRGFMSNTASIPKILRGKIMDNDDLDLVIPCWLVHDASFLYRFWGNSKHGFKRANRIMKEMIKLGGSSRFRAFILWFGVSSLTGFRIYKKNRFGDYKTKFVDMNIQPREIEIYE